MENKEYKKGSLEWLRECARKDGFDNIRDWQNWKRLQKNIKNIYQIKVYDNSQLSDKEREDFYRFWSKVDIKDNIEECWNWTAFIYPNGYGVFKFNCGNVLSHRMAYILSKGKIPSELQVQHLCNNPTCCNPSHLELGDNSKNMRYMIKCGRYNSYGENSSFSRLTEDQVREILKIHKEHSELTQYEIAKMFCISQPQISRIINGKGGIGWNHVYNSIKGDNIK